MKQNRFLIGISFMTLIVIIIGATFSYFNIMIKSNDDAVSINAATLGIKLNIKPLYERFDLIPLDNADVIKAFNAECIDNIGNSACTVYTIEVTNEGGDTDYFGSIKFYLNELTNLNYMVLNEDNSVYKDITTIVSDTDQSLGEQFPLSNGESRLFKLIIWLPNFDRIQDEEDGLGSFNALVTYSSTAGSKVTGTFTN